MENFFPRKWKTDIFSHCVRTSDSVWEWNGNGNLFRLYWQECMKCCKSALLTECFSTVLDSLWGSPNSLLLFELLQPTLSHYRYTYSIVVEEALLSSSNNPWGTLIFLGVKAPRMCLTLPTCEYFLCWAQHRNPSEVYDSQLGCVIQSWSVQYGRQQQQQQQPVASVAQKDRGWQIVHLHRSLCPSQHLSL